MYDTATSGSDANFTACPANFSATESESTHEELSYKVVVAVFASVLAFVIFVGNGLIIVSVCVVNKLRQPANYLIVSLALSDFLVALVVLPLTIIYDILGEWVFGSTVCNIHVGFDVICCATSILNLVMISIDRYLMVTRPLTYPKIRTAKLMAVMISSAWILACLVIFPALFGFTRNVNDEPSWIDLGNGSPKFGNATDSSLPSAVPASENATFWALCSSRHLEWQYVVDLQEEYYITQAKFSSQNNSMLEFQMQMIRPNVNETELFAFLLHPFAAAEITKTPAKYIRVLLAGDQVKYLNQTSFTVFGEQIHGKTCLISQEKWFTVYSTVCSFYLPLAVMLFMYYKIYQEASRFKARLRSRSKSLTERPHSFLSQPSLCPDNVKMSACDLTSDLENCDCEIQRRSEHFEDQCGAQLESATTRLSPSVNSTPGGSDVAVPAERHGESLSVPTSPGYDAGSCSLPPSPGNFSDAYHRESEHPSQEFGRLKGCDDDDERNGNLLDLDDSPHGWCKKLHYSAASMNQSDGSEVANGGCQLNGRSLAAKAKAPLVRGGKSLLSMRRKSMRAGSFVAAKTKRGSIYIRRRFSTASNRERLRNAKAIRTLGIIVAAFTLCWLPFFTLTFMRPFVCDDPNSKSDCFPEWLVRLVLWLGYINSALNPLIYVGFSSDLRETFRFLICCQCANVDRRLAQIELRKAIEEERRQSGGIFELDGAP